jgi:5'-methylthioadenosine phosphorylase
MIHKKISIAVIGGSGLYAMPGLSQVSEQHIETPFGTPSDVIVTGQLGNIDVAFLARHGRGHRLLPGEVPYRANIYALKSLGVRYLISVSAIGSLREQIRPLDVVLPQQFIDLTRQRQGTFFGQGAVAHIALANPVCNGLHNVLQQAAKSQCVKNERHVHEKSTYVCVEGPGFSTYAESLWFRSMNADVIGMTAQPEAKLAREAQMAYALLALVTDYDCWHPRETTVSASFALQNLQKNTDLAQRIVIEAVKRLAVAPPVSQAHSALASALVTQPDAMPAPLRQRLELLWS